MTVRVSLPDRIEISIPAKSSEARGEDTSDPTQHRPRGTVDQTTWFPGRLLGEAATAALTLPPPPAPLVRPDPGGNGEVGAVQGVDLVGEVGVRAPPRHSDVVPVVRPEPRRHRRVGHDVVLGLDEDVGEEEGRGRPLVPPGSLPETPTTVVRLQNSEGGRGPLLDRADREPPPRAGVNLHGPAPVPVQDVVVRGTGGWRMRGPRGATEPPRQPKDEE